MPAARTLTDAGVISYQASWRGYVNDQGGPYAHPFYDRLSQ